MSTIDGQRHSDGFELRIEPDWAKNRRIWCLLDAQARPSLPWTDSWPAPKVANVGGLFQLVKRRPGVGGGWWSTSQDGWAREEKRTVNADIASALEPLGQ